MKGFLPFYRISEPQDWQKTGSHYNWQITARPCFDLGLLPFFIDDQIAAGATTISEFKFQKVNISGNTKTVTVSNTLLTTLINIISGTTYDIYEYLATTEQIEFDNGIYQFYVKNSLGDEWVSELICYNPDFITDYGDFNDDFNDDFFYGWTNEGVLKIEAQRLPTIYPSIYFKDRIFTSNRLIKKGTSEVKIITDQKFYTCDDENTQKNRLIQSVSYDVYELELFGGENAGIELLEKADNVTITDEEGRIFLADFLEPILAERLFDTNLNKYKIVFQDVNIANYGDNVQPVSNFMLGSYLTQIYSASTINKFKIITGRTIDADFQALGNWYQVYSCLNPVLDTANSMLTHTEGNTVYNVQGITKKVVNFRCFLTDYEKSVIEKYAHLCNQLYVYKGSSIIYQNVGITPELKIDIKQGDLYGIWQCDISMVYQYVVSNFFDFGTLANNFGIYGLYKLDYSSSSTIDAEFTAMSNHFILYTVIGRLMQSDDDLSTDKDGNRLTVTARSSNKKQYELIYYATGANARILKKYANMVTVSLQIIGGAVLPLIEQPQVTVEKIVEYQDIYRCTVIASTDFLTYDLFDN